MALTMERIGITVECHHHEVATAGQCEIDMKFDTLVAMADNLMKYKYVVKNVARRARQDRDLHAQAAVRRQRLGHARATSRSGTATSRSSAIAAGYAGLSQTRALLHRRPAQARAGAARLRRADHQLLPPPGAGLRGAGQPRLVAAQPLGRGAHPDVLATAPRPSASSSAAPTRRATPTSRSRRC